MLYWQSELFNRKCRFVIVFLLLQTEVCSLDSFKAKYLINCSSDWHRIRFILRIYRSVTMFLKTFGASWPFLKLQLHLCTVNIQRERYQWLRVWQYMCSSLAVQHKTFCPVWNFLASERLVNYCQKSIYVDILAQKLQSASSTRDVLAVHQLLSISESVHSVLLNMQNV